MLLLFLASTFLFIACSKTAENVIETTPINSTTSAVEVKPTVTSQPTPDWVGEVVNAVSYTHLTLPTILLV